MHAEPQAEHQWLQQLVGEWTYETEATMAPGEPPMKMQGAETARTLGGMWVLSEGNWTMPDGNPATVLFTFGYDPARAKYVGSFIGSMMANMWLYEGSLDASQKVLTLDTEGPSFAGDGTLSKYQDIIEIVDANHRVLKSRVQMPDGSWNEFMMARYQRK